jgi:hypothetical protein
VSRCSLAIRESERAAREPRQVLSALLGREHDNGAETSGPKPSGARTAGLALGIYFLLLHEVGTANISPGTEAIAPTVVVALTHAAWGSGPLALADCTRIGRWLRTLARRAFYAFVAGQSVAGSRA